jgi:hypothetical protein
MSGMHGTLRAYPLYSLLIWFLGTEESGMHGTSRAYPLYSLLIWFLGTEDICSESQHANWIIKPADFAGFFPVIDS